MNGPERPKKEKIMKVIPIYPCDRWDFFMRAEYYGRATEEDL